MGILDELKVFLKSILSAVFLFLGVSFFFFIFPLGNSITLQVFRKIQYDLLPPAVKLIVTNPLNAFVSEIELSMLLAFIILFPFFLYKIIKYLIPALFPHEKKLLLQSLIPSSLLFFAGCFFSYHYIIPITFKMLYPYAINLGVMPFFSLTEFTSSVFSLMVITGIMFLLPIFMTLLSFLSIVKPQFWKNHLRHALLFFLIFTAIITPDGTGITMLFLFFPLTLLYLLGCLLTQKLKGRSINIKETGVGRINKINS